MPQRILRFRIRQDGVVEETVQGVVGTDCYQLTEKLESALGSVQQRQSKSEAYDCSEEQTKLTQDHIQVI